MRFSSRLAAGAAAVALAASGTLMGAASAQEAAPNAPRGVQAKLDGRTIDLSKSWGGADVCAQSASGEVQCRDTSRSNSRGGKTEAALKKCAKHNVCLYENRNFKGRMLKFNDEEWHNLSKWGFSNKTSSWKNNQDGDGPLKDHASLADGRNGGGKRYSMKQGESARGMGNFDNKASSVHG